MDKAKYLVLVGVIGVAAAGSWAMAANAGPEPLAPRADVFNSVSACGPNEPVLNAIGELAPATEGLPETPVQALARFRESVYPGLPTSPSEVLADQGSLLRYSYESERGVELIVDVAARDDRFGVAGWTGCDSYLVETTTR